MTFTPFTYDKHLKFLTDTLRVQLPEADLSTGSFWQIWAQGQARGLASVTSALNFTLRQILPDQARGLDLDHHGSVYDLPRLQPDKARGTVTGTAVAPYQPSTTPDLYLVDLSGKKYDLDDIDSFEVPFAGAFQVKVIAREVGSAGNQVPDTPLYFASGTTVPTALDPEVRVLKPGLTGGRELETDPAMQARIVTTLSAGRLKDREEDYEAWALTAPPVEDNGLRSVSQVFVYRDPEAPDRVYVFPLLKAPERIGPDGLAQSVFNAVESYAPVTVDPLVPRIVPIPVDVSLRLKPTARARWDWYGYQRIVTGVASEPDRAIQLKVGTEANGVELHGVDGLRPGMRVLVNGEQRRIGNVDHQNEILTFTEAFTTIPAADDSVFPGGMITEPVQQAIRSLFEATTPIHRAAMSELDPVTVLKSAVTDITMEVEDVHDVDDVEISGLDVALLSDPAYQTGTLAYLAVPGEISVMPMSGT